MHSTHASLILSLSLLATAWVSVASLGSSLEQMVAGDRAQGGAQQVGWGGGAITADAAHHGQHIADNTSYRTHIADNKSHTHLADNISHRTHITENTSHRSH